MAKVIYTAQAHVTGGREHGHGKTPGGELDVELRLPAEMAVPAAVGLSANGAAL